MSAMAMSRQPSGIRFRIEERDTEAAVSRLGGLKMKLRWLGGSTLLLVCCFSGQEMGAQEAPASCNSVVSGPTDVTLALSLKGGQTVYHEGEIIALDLAFTSSSRNRFLNLRQHDRSGRLDEDLFCLTPEARDPLEDYFYSGIYTSWFGGGLSAPPIELSAVPHRINEDLNEWKSPPPGSYTLFVLSYRIEAPLLKTPKQRHGPSFPIESDFK
jgi:hypothetical protein